MHCPASHRQNVAPFCSLRSKVQFFEEQISFSSETDLVVK